MPIGSSNLLVVKTPPRSIPEQQVLVRAWQTARAKGETQMAFCSRQQPPVSVRALRGYIGRHAPAAPPLGVALAIIDRALVGLRELRASIADRHADRTTEEPPSRTIDPPTTPTPPKADQVTTAPRRPFSFDDDEV
jgi:hypothetical protein